MIQADILILGSDPKGGHLLPQLLIAAGAQVTQVSSAAAFRSHLAQHLPEIILFDLIRPDVATYQLCAELKKGKATASIPVMFLSTSRDVMDKVRAFDAGGADYLMKPLEQSETLVRIEHQLKLARGQQALEREKAALQKSYERLHAPTPGPHSGALSEHLAGATLDGKYLLESKLGSGGFGTVYRGLQLALQRPVAVKVLRFEHHDDAAVQLERFRREGVSTCRVHHRNAIEVIDIAVSEQGLPYLVMELLSGRSLQDELHRCGGLLPLSRCMELITPVCEVLIVAHASGVLHRDIKPENIFLHLSPQGEVVKVLDFGLAELRDTDDSPMTRLTRPQFVLGTSLFMAPERVRGKADLDGRADVYSVAVMLYLMLSGERPFPAEVDDNLKMMLAQLNDPPIPLRQRLPALPGTVEAAVMSGFAKKPAERPTMSAFLRRLQVAVSTGSQDD
jgi:CheY-like chemotaxis protein